MTLIEALVAVAITVLIGALAFPQLDRMLEDQALAQAAVALRSDLRVARADAMRGGRAIAFTPDRGGRSYRWGRTPRDLDPALRLAGKPILFLPDGSSSGGRLTLAGERRRVLIGIDPGSGLPLPSGA